MADKFRVGQRVRIIYVETDDERYVVGATATVLTGRYLQTCGDGSVMFAYDVDIDPEYDDEWEWMFKEEQLEPVYDGDEKSSWSECAWKPQTEPKPISTITK